MKKLIDVLFVLPWILVSCSQDAAQGVEESVEVNFLTAIPGQIGTRASDLSVNKLVCAVFEKGEEVKALRTTINIENSSMISYEPRLVKGRTYNVVFWAMKDENYDVSDLTAIVRSSTRSSDEADYDAFTATTQITVVSSETIDVTLTRPLAQLNIGVTEDDWKAVVALGQTPYNTSISYVSYDAFNALTGGLLTRNHGPITRTARALGTFEVGSTTYSSLGSFYVFVDDSTTEDIEFTFRDENEKDIRSDVMIYSVPIQRNYKTNIVGGLLTGIITYNISLDGLFEDEDINKDINQTL